MPVLIDNQLSLTTLCAKHGLSENQQRRDIYNQWVV